MNNLPEGTYKDAQEKFDLRARIAALEASLAEARKVLEVVDGLIRYQYTGSQEAMSYLQVMCDQAHAALKETK